MSEFGTFGQSRAGAPLDRYQAPCVACHGGPTGGTISDIPPRHDAEGHSWHHADCDLVEIVKDGIRPRDGYRVMPAFDERLTDEEIRLILEQAVVHAGSWPSVTCQHC